MRPTALSTGNVLSRCTMADTNEDRMKDVSHTPPNGDSVTNVWERGATTDDEPATPADD